MPIDFRIISSYLLLDPHPVVTRRSLESPDVMVGPTLVTCTRIAHLYNVRRAGLPYGAGAAAVPEMSSRTGGKGSSSGTPFT